MPSGLYLPTPCIDKFCVGVSGHNFGALFPPSFPFRSVQTNVVVGCRATGREPGRWHGGNGISRMWMFLPSFALLEVSTPFWWRMWFSILESFGLQVYCPKKESRFPFLSIQLFMACQSYCSLHHPTYSPFAQNDWHSRSRVANFSQRIRTGGFSRREETEELAASAKRLLFQQIRNNFL